jgi:hypothetical protein
MQNLTLISDPVGVHCVVVKVGSVKLTQSHATSRSSTVAIIVGRSLLKSGGQPKPAGLAVMLLELRDSCAVGTRTKIINVNVLWSIHRLPLTVPVVDLMPDRR